MAKGMWGIDVSKGSVKAVRLEGGPTGLTLTQAKVVPYPGKSGGGESEDMDALILEALQEIKSTCKIGGEPVVFSLPSHSTFNRLIKLPPVDDSKIPEIVQYEADQQIPFDINEVIWDYQLVDREYQPGEEKEVLLFAIKRDIVEQFLGNIAPLGLSVDAVQFAPVALFNFLLKDQELTGPSVALDMGGENTDLIVLDGNKFWIRNLPITGQDVTKALQKAFNIPFEEAEKLKLKAAQSQQAQKIFNAIQPVLRDLVNEVNRSMGYYKSISRTSKFEKIILLGNATRTLNFQRFVSQSLQLPAARVQKLNSISIGPSVDAGEFNEALPTLGTALGLALQGLGQTVNRVNLLPPVFLKKKELKKKQPFILGTIAALWILVVVMWQVAVGKADELKKLHESANQAGKAAAAQKKAFKAAKNVKDVEQHLLPLLRVPKERDLILKVMNEINPNIPDNSAKGMSDRMRIWIVDMKFNVAPVEQKATAGGGKLKVFTVGQKRAMNTNTRPMPDKEMLEVTIEAVIAKRLSDTDGVNFITKTLLNYHIGRRRPDQASKPCAIHNDTWKLSERRGEAGWWGVVRDASGDLVWPVPKSFPTSDEEPITEAKYSRYIVTLSIPVGKDHRAEKPEKAAKAAAGKSSTGKMKSK